MTGFARATGESDGRSWNWEVKSVNGKGLDVRCRLPSGSDALEAAVRSKAAEKQVDAALTEILDVPGLFDPPPEKVARALEPMPPGMRGDEP